MFTIAQIIDVLQRQHPETMLMNLHAETTIFGLELRGRTQQGTDYRIFDKAQNPAASCEVEKAYRDLGENGGG